MPISSSSSSSLPVLIHWFGFSHEKHQSASQGNWGVRWRHIYKRKENNNNKKTQDFFGVTSVSKRNKKNALNWQLLVKVKHWMEKLALGYALRSIGGTTRVENVFELKMRMRPNIKRQRRGMENQFQSETFTTTLISRRVVSVVANASAITQVICCVDRKSEAVNRARL